MLIRVLITLCVLTTVAPAFHLNTFAVFELREQLQMLYMNMWELLHQLEYVTADQRLVVYEEITHIRSQIQHTIDELIRLDKEQH